MNPFLLNTLGLRGISGKFEEAQPAEIEVFEDSLGATLPADYREFLLKFAPSLFQESVAYTPIECSVWAEDGMETMDIFYGISDRPGFDIRWTNRFLASALPARMIAVGHDSFANRILLSLDDSAIRFMDRDTATLTLVAKSFTDFLQSFKRLS